MMRQTGAERWEAIVLVTLRVTFPHAEREEYIRASLLILSIFVSRLLMPVATCGAEISLLAERATLDQQFVVKLESLAAKCDELGMTAEASATREWSLPPALGRQQLFLPSEENVGEAMHIDESASANQAFWRKKFFALRGDQAGALVSLARKAIEEDELFHGYRWLHDALREDPDQPIARRALEFRVVNDRWRRAGAAPKAEVARVRHPRLDFAAGKYWRVESAHFRFTTDESPEAGLDLAARLEEFHDVWRQLFVEYWATRDMLLARFEQSKPATRPRKKFRVTLFRDRDGYIANLKARQPLIEQSVGIYFDDDEESYFYLDEGDSRGQTPPTWFHETAHQLFQETMRRPRGAGQEANFWAIEGAALYMESLAKMSPEDDAARSGYVTLGGYDAERLQFARYRALCEKFYVPLEDFIRLGKDAVQQDPNLRKLYSQAAGLSHFLMDGGEGRHRGRFVAYLTAIYEQRAAADAMPRLWGEEFAGLDAEYAKYLVVTDSDLIASPPPAAIKSLVLPGEGITDAGLKQLAGCRALEWLNLSRTKITDQGLASFEKLASLRNLSLEQTSITDAGLVALLPLHQLIELDLSHTQVIGDRLVMLAPLESLQRLILTGINLDGAQRERLKRVLPKVEIAR